MKKVFGFFSAFVLVTAAYAMPKVGDTVVHVGSVTKNGAVTIGQLEMRMVSYDKASKKFDIQRTLNVNGSSEVTHELTEETKLLTDATVNYILNNCAASGGYATAVTVPAGNFNTCALPTSGDTVGTVWMAAGVPFGVVKWNIIQKSDSSNTQFELQSFQNGN